MMNEYSKMSMITTTVGVMNSDPSDTTMILDRFMDESHSQALIRPLNIELNEVISNLTRLRNSTSDSRIRKELEENIIKCHRIRDSISFDSLNSSL